MVKKKHTPKSVLQLVEKAFSTSCETVEKVGKIACSSLRRRTKVLREGENTQNT